MRSIRLLSLVGLLMTGLALSAPPAAASPTSPTVPEDSMTVPQASPSNPVAPLEAKDLTYAATARCRACGAGLAYAEDRPTLPFMIPSQWDCSAVLLGEVVDNVAAHDAYPFAFYEIKSEDQPSANGRSTRPAEPMGQSLQRAFVRAERHLSALRAERQRLVTPDLTKTDREIAHSEHVLATARAALVPAPSSA